MILLSHTHNCCIFTHTLQTYTHAHMYTCKHVLAHTHTHLCIIPTCVYVLMCTCICTHVHTYTCAYVQVKQILYDCFDMAVLKQISVRGVYYQYLYLIGYLPRGSSSKQYFPPIFLFRLQTSTVCCYFYLSRL